MSSERVLLVLAGATIDLAAVWQLFRARSETSLARLRPIGRRTRALAAIALFLSFIAPLVSVVVAFNRLESVDIQHRAVALGEGISDAMNHACLSLALALPSLIIALYLNGKVRAIERQSARP